MFAAHAAQVVIASPQDNGRFPAEINHGSSLVTDLTASGR